MATAAQQRRQPEQHVEEEEESEFSAWDCGSPLYDSFEVASLCHLLDRHLMFLPVSSGGSAGSDDAPAGARLASADDGKMVPVKDREKRLRRMRRHGKRRSSTTADGNEKVLKATLRGIRSAFFTFWRKHK